MRTCTSSCHGHWCKAVHPPYVELHGNVVLRPLVRMEANGVAAAAGAGGAADPLMLRTIRGEEVERPPFW